MGQRGRGPGGTTWGPPRGESEGRAARAECSPRMACSTASSQIAAYTTSGNGRFPSLAGPIRVWPLPNGREGRPMPASLSDGLVLAVLLAVVLTFLAGEGWLLAQRNRPLTIDEQAWLHRGQRLAGFGTFPLGLISVARLWPAAGVEAGVWPAVLGAAILLVCGGVAIVAGIIDGQVSGGWPTRTLTGLYLALVVLYTAAVVLAVNRILRPDTNLLILPLFSTLFVTQASGRLRGEAQRSSDQIVPHQRS